VAAHVDVANDLLLESRESPDEIFPAGE